MRTALTAKQEATCQRCHGAFDSLLHALCVINLQREEVEAGYRDRVYIEAHRRPQLRGLVPR